MPEVSVFHVAYAKTFSGRSSIGHRGNSHLTVIVRHIPETPDEVRLGKFGRRPSTVSRTLIRLEERKQAAELAAAMGEGAKRSE